MHHGCFVLFQISKISYFLYYLAYKLLTRVFLRIDCKMPHVASPFFLKLLKYQILEMRNKLND
jgi:hypothetical protein